MHLKKVKIDMECKIAPRKTKCENNSHERRKIELVLGKKSQKNEYS